jgi:hypothetical protein
MGILEFLLVIAIALKWAGVAFVTTSYPVMLGYYLGGWACMVCFGLAFTMTKKLFA